MAYAFLHAQGKKIGNSLCEESQVQLAKNILRSVDARNVQLLIPVDHIITSDIKSSDATQTEGPDIPEGKMGVDIGPKSIETYKKALEKAETIFWNGPMGVFENPAFANGTFSLAKAIAQSGARKLAGGGDVAAAIGKSGCGGQFDFISTGGGATLEFLEGKNLPGLEALELPKQRG